MRSVGYLPPCPSPREEDGLLLGLLHSLLALRFNTLPMASPAFSGVEGPSFPVDAMQTASVPMKNFGLGVFPSLAMFNHSCVPNGEILYLGKTVVG